MVAAHPWVYAATQPKNDIYPILDRIFADMSYARVDAIELMHTALRPTDAVERIGEPCSTTRACSFRGWPSSAAGRSERASAMRVRVGRAVLAQCEYPRMPLAVY